MVEYTNTSLGGYQGEGAQADVCLICFALIPQYIVTSKQNGKIEGHNARERHTQWHEENLGTNSHQENDK